jgi:dihydrofolate reductase
MGKITVFTRLTLDGVMQAPGRPDEDTRGGFQHGGWALPYNDPVMAKIAGEAMASTGAVVLGRRTYVDFAGFWPKHEGQSVHRRFEQDAEIRRVHNT